VKFVQFAFSSATVVLVVLSLTGCGKVKTLAGKAKTAAQQQAANLKKQATEKLESASTDVQEELQMAGKASLTLDGPLETKACYARFVTQGEKRPTVFELRSYSSPDKEEYPSVFFHSQIQAKTAAELSGQVVSGRLFVQPNADGPTWFSAVGTPVELQIKSIADNMLTAEIVSASLQNTQTGAATAATGSFSAVQR